jgi:hypothetical protein
MPSCQKLFKATNWRMRALAAAPRNINVNDVNLDETFPQEVSDAE